MTSALALQAALRLRLLADAPLVALLGGPKLFDDVPQAEPFPYITFGASTVEPLNGLDSELDRHVVTLQVFSRQPGRTEAATIIAALKRILVDTPLTLTNHHLVNLAVAFEEVRREPDGETRRGILRLRAVTEPLS
jgi:hypothetical protein